MGNYTSKGGEEQTTPNPKLSTTIKAPQSCLSLPENKIGSSMTNPSPSSSSTVYHSTRIQNMIENKSKFTSDLEFDIEYSKDHWSDFDQISNTEHGGETDREYFEVLKNDPQWGGQFFREFDLEVGNKLAEGAQAEIFEAKIKFEDGSKSEHYNYVVKAFKQGCPLRRLQQQWPPGMLMAASKRQLHLPLHWIEGGTLLKDKRLMNRFALVMRRHSGDLRKVIDLRMQKNRIMPADERAVENIHIGDVQKSIALRMQRNKRAAERKAVTGCAIRNDTFCFSESQGPPFHIDRVKRLMLNIAEDMVILHQEHNILHRDLKASNVLVWFPNYADLSQNEDAFHATVGDFECSIGVAGTGFWRAPEILQQLKNETPSSKLEFSKASDVYSYGMTCYEIVTGCIPFEDQPHSNYNIVIEGQRPELPHYGMDPLVKDIIVSCWHTNPSQRPSFQEICKKIHYDVENLKNRGKFKWEDFTKV